MDFLLLLFHTIELRPYVFLFLLLYILGCSLHLGLKRSLIFCVVGYGIAWLSEYSSIHNGFPYGDYFYIEQTKGKELWICGVPFFDSLSYVFLAYASYTMALLICSPVMLLRKTLYVLETRALRKSRIVGALGAVLFVYLDIIIDPVALKGGKWFLGQIYGYPDDGAYFGVPISNFAGWLLVGFLMINALQIIDNCLHRTGASDHAGYHYPWRYLAGPLLYFGVMIFNLSVTFWIGEHTLGWAGIFIVALPSLLIYTIIKTKLSAGDRQKSLDAHLGDFPLAAITIAVESDPH
ncbi:MAG: carotenoid biosynthesis protein [Nitrospirae bacterium]|nr:carotenoid biosynthesis protein [Nitrospirota bacterium]